MMKSSIDVEKTDITQLDVDAIVNAANRNLAHGGGVCGAIFQKAGPHRLADACSEIGGCETGNAVITSGFDLKARMLYDWASNLLEESKKLSDGTLMLKDAKRTCLRAINALPNTNSRLS